jgi:hypothetical protein
MRRKYQFFFLPLLLVLLSFFPLQAAADQQRGDANGDGKVNITDVTVLIDYLLGGATINLDAADVNNNATVTIADLTALLDLLLTTP